MNKDIVLTNPHTLCSSYWSIVDEIMYCCQDTPMDMLNVLNIQFISISIFEYDLLLKNEIEIFRALGIRVYVERDIEIPFETYIIGLRLMRNSTCYCFPFDAIRSVKIYIRVEPISTSINSDDINNNGSTDQNFYMMFIEEFDPFATVRNDEWSTQFVSIINITKNVSLLGGNIFLPPIFSKNDKN